MRFLGSRTLEQLVKDGRQLSKLVGIRGKDRQAYKAPIR